MNNFLKRNASTILTCLGGVGVVATSVLTAKATPKAMSLLEKAKEEKGGDLTKIEAIKTSIYSYIPAAITGAVTLACIFSANALNKKQQVALISAYVLLDNKLKDYKEKIKEIYGEEKHQNVVNSIFAEKTKEINIYSECLGFSCDLSVEDNDGEPKLFYDEYSNRYFEATIEKVLSAEYHLNRNYILKGRTVLNEFYDFLGLETTEYGSILGWVQLDDKTHWIDFNHKKVVMEDGMECYILELKFEPSIDYLKY